MLTKYSRFVTIGKQMSGMRFASQAGCQPNRYQICEMCGHVEKKTYLLVNDLFS